MQLSLCRWCCCFLCASPSPPLKAAVKREQSDACISSAEREQARPKVKGRGWRTGSSSTIDIVKAASEVLGNIYRQGYHYKKAGVIVIKHGPKEQREQSQAGLDSAESRLRKSKTQFKSKNPTTRWSDIIVLK